MPINIFMPPLSTMCFSSETSDLMYHAYVYALFTTSKLAYAAKVVTPVSLAFVVATTSTLYYPSTNFIVSKKNILLGFKHLSYV